MPTLAPKLPYTHPFSGGYPRLGGQPLPTDPDAIDYLARVAAADGAAVEVGVAMAVDAFVRGCKADGIWTALKASCIMCGARTISGALVPLVGAAPTPYNFVAADYDRSGGGLKGDGATKYLDSNRANDADGQDDCHQSVYASSINTLATAFVGNVDRSTPESGSFVLVRGTGTILARLNSDQNNETSLFSGSGFVGVNRSSASSQTVRADGADVTESYASTFLNTRSNFVFARDDADGTPDYTDARLAFYSIGSALDLALLDNRVSTLVASIAAAL